MFEKFKSKVKRKLSREDIIKAFNNDDTWYISNHFTFLELLYVLKLKIFGGN